MSEPHEQATSDYTYWLNALDGKFGDVHEGDPQFGFYRQKDRRTGRYVPVAIFPHDGAIVALVNGRQADPYDLWQWVSNKPISEEQYHAVINGAIWPDEDQSVVTSLAPQEIGSNNPPTDEAEILKGQIEAASAGAYAYAEVNDDETAAKAQSLRSRLLELSREADKKHGVEKAPSLEEGRRIDKRWFPLRDLAKDAADKIRKALSAHETRKARAAEAARLKAEQKHIAAEEAARKAAEAGKPIPTPPLVQESSPPPQTRISGAYGRAAAIKVAKIAKVTDQDKLYVYLKSHKELIECMAKLAQRAVDAGYEPDGVTIEEVRKVS